MTGPVTSVELSAWNPSLYPGYAGAPSATYTLYDVTTPIATLNADQSGAVAIYNDLGSGVAFGSVSVSAADNGTQVIVDLNAAGIAAVNANLGGEFAIGGTLGTYSPPGTPEPSPRP